jgi:hypothetical protein
LVHVKDDAAHKLQKWAVDRLAVQQHERHVERREHTLNISRCISCIFCNEPGFWERVEVCRLAGEKRVEPRNKLGGIFVREDEMEIIIEKFDTDREFRISQAFLDGVLTLFSDDFVGLRSTNSAETRQH